MTEAQEHPRRIALTPETRTPGLTQGRRATDTVRKILEAGGTVFRRDGWARSSVDAIASEAGISRASVYTYFRSKRDILITLGAQNNDRFQELVLAVADIDGPLSVDSLHNWLDDYVDFLDADQSFTSVWQEAATVDQALRVESVKQYEVAWTNLAKGWAALAPGYEPNPRDAMLVIAAAERAWYYWRRLEVFTDREEVIDLLGRMICGLVTPHAGQLPCASTAEAIPSA